MTPFQSYSSNAAQSLAASLRTTHGDQVPLLGVALRGEVFGAHARMVLRQRYKNRETQPIEAIYTFPIPSDATLVGFAMECEGRRIEAEVQEREAAFAKYDEAIAKGHGAALLEQERPNVFTASVGNLLPNEETVIEVAYIQKLTADEGALRLMIPTLVAPKYIPGVPTGDRSAHGMANPTDIVPDADRISPKIGDVKYGLSMDIVFDLGRKVTIESPSHAIQTIAESDLRQRVTFSSQIVALDRNIVLVAEGAAGVVAGVVCDKRPDEEGTFALTLVPDLFEAKKTSKGRAVVFVVDVSGSMQGESLEQAKLAMRLCLRHLSEGDLFDIVPFSSSYSHFSLYSKLSPDLIPFTQKTLKEVDRYVDGLVANGGTEMLEPLSAATRLLAGVERDRLIVLLTDGQVGNEGQIVEEIAKKAAGARVYTFGIGLNVSDLLLRDLARRTKGAVEFIHPGERIDEKVTAQFARATAVRIDELNVKWVGVDAGEVSPGEPPALVDGEPWSVYGRYETPSVGRVEIRGTLGGEPFFLEVPIDLASRANRPALTSLWAGARVRDLEQADMVSLGRRAEAHKQRIVNLCVKHGIASQYASFVVVEKRTGERRVQVQPETRVVPVHAPAGGAVRAALPSKKKANVNLKDRLGRPQDIPFSITLTESAPSMAPLRGVKAGVPVPASAKPAAPSQRDPAAMSQRAPAEQVKDKPSEVGLLQRMKQALGFSKEEAKVEETTRRAESRASKVSPPAPKVAAPAVDAPAVNDLGSVFARQLASGLWESRDGSDKGYLLATTAVLERCVREGIDTSHAVYGAQVIKAVDALCPLVEKNALAGTDDNEVIRSLLVMAAVSTGKRARTRLEALAKAAKNEAVKSIAAHLANQEAAQKRLANSAT
ncbi:MAG TPA: VIT and VWA domain-containing protein [Polyangium sp.]|nr:VIT and VWA domain-containing protein [Polyangium sp.]